MVSLTVGGATLSGDVYITNSNECFLSISGMSSIMSYSITKQLSTSGPFHGTSYPLYAAEDGPYSITFDFTDLTGKSVQTNPVVAFVDTVAPSLLSLHVHNASFMNGIYYTTFFGGSIHIDSSDALPIVSYYYNSLGPYPLDSSSIPLQTNANGSYTISVQLKDLAGNLSNISSITVMVQTEIPTITLTDINGMNLSGTTTHYTTAYLNISGDTGYTFNVQLNGIVRPLAIAYKGRSMRHTIRPRVSRQITFTNLSGFQTVVVVFTSQSGYSVSSTISWFVNPFSDVPILTLHPSQNTLRIDVSGEADTTYLLSLSGANVLSYSGTISGFVTLHAQNLFCGPTSLVVSITNYAGYTTYSTPISYTVPIVLTASDTILSWNGQVSSYMVYRVDIYATRIDTIAIPFYDVSPYSGLTLTFYIATEIQSSNHVTLTIPVNTQAVQTISPIEYILAGITSDVSSSILRSTLNAYDASASISIVSSGISKLVPITGIPDSSFAVVVGPSGSTINVATEQLYGIPAIYIAAAPNTTKTFVFDDSYMITIAFDVSSIQIGGITYLLGSTVSFGNVLYTVVWFGSVYLQRIYAYVPDAQHRIVRPLSIRELRSANVQPTGTNIAEYIEGREMVRQVLSKGRQQRFPDYSSYMKYLKGKTYVQIQRGSGYQ